MPTPYDEWTIFAIADQLCRECDLPVLVIAQSEVANEVSLSAFICMSGLHLRDFSTFTRDEYEQLNSRLQFSLMTMGKLGLNMSFLTGLQVVVEQIASISTEKPLVEPGFRMVAWLKPEEAQAVIDCHASKGKVAILDDQGQPVFEAMYHSDSDPDAIKYRANCEAVRGSRGWRKWIRLEEAQAVVASNESHCDVEFAHLKFGTGGVVKYFPSSSAEAKKFRSTTLLLRRS